jgi:hypothetical protein
MLTNSHCILPIILAKANKQSMIHKQRRSTTYVVYFVEQYQLLEKSVVNA